MITSKYFKMLCIMYRNQNGSVRSRTNLHQSWSPWHKHLYVL